MTDSTGPEAVPQTVAAVDVNRTQISQSVDDPNRAAFHPTWLGDGFRLVISSTTND